MTKKLLSSDFYFQNSSFTYFWGGGGDPENTTVTPEKNDFTNKWFRFLESARWKTPTVPIFIKIGQTLDFGNFLGDKLPKKPKFLVKKNVRTEIWMLFLKSAPSKTPIYQISSKSDKISISVTFWGHPP